MNHTLFQFISLFFSCWLFVVAFIHLSYSIGICRRLAHFRQHRKLSKLHVVLTTVLIHFTYCCFCHGLFFFILGTPINRLPIMAKSVLDLYELYNLVIARGGLVDVINKKLWQEIIKGLHLPSSITSAAFTLRTQ